MPTREQKNNWHRTEPLLYYIEESFIKLSLCTRLRKCFAATSVLDIRYLQLSYRHLRCCKLPFQLHISNNWSPSIVYLNGCKMFCIAIFCFIGNPWRKTNKNLLQAFTSIFRRALTVVNSVNEIFTFLSEEVLGSWSISFQVFFSTISFFFIFSLLHSPYKTLMLRTF